MIKIIILTFFISIFSTAFAVDYTLHGVADIRASSLDSLTTYVDGGYGKFSIDDGQQLAIGQLGGDLTLQWDSGISAHVVANAYVNNSESVAGITEGYLKYRSLPNASGYRWQTKVGIFYPEISLENNAVAWASIDTLNSSTINTWIGEEIRVLGGEFKLTRLGRITNAPYDLSLSAATFINNDPAGALLAWHGWTIGNRQTLWTESQPITYFNARMPGFSLSEQASKSDPFLELDNKVGYHINGEVKVHGKGAFSIGYYDNNATPYKVKHGQYGWHTRFYHAGLQWKLSSQLQLKAQYLTGKTLMQSPSRWDIVNNDYQSAYVSLTKKWQQHKLTARLEEFSVQDNDQTWGDNNNEYGKAATLNYTYRLAKPWFISTEYSWISSRRAARYYVHAPADLIERQLQLAVRYFF
ncbi:hypothetical protein AAD001_15905 [Colwelliaceae bacterium 6471]